MALPYDYQGNDPGRSGANIGNGGNPGTGYTGGRGAFGGGGGVIGGYAGPTPGYTNGPSIGELIYKLRRQYPGLGWNGLGKDDSQNATGYQGFIDQYPDENAPQTLPGYNGAQTLQRLSDTAMYLRGLGAHPAQARNALNRSPGVSEFGRNPMQALIQARARRMPRFGSPDPMRPGMNSGTDL